MLRNPNFKLLNHCDIQKRIQIILFISKESQQKNLHSNAESNKTKKIKKTLTLS